MGAYKATPIPVLEAEARIPPIEIYLNRIAMRYQALRGTHPNTVKGTAEIRRRLRGRRGRARKPPPTPSQKKERWTLEEIGIPYWDAAATGIRKKKDWYNPVRDVERFQDCKEIARKVEERCQEKWAQR